TGLRCGIIAPRQGAKYGHTREVWEKGRFNRQACDAQVQKGSAQGGQGQPPKSKEPQAGHRDRSLGGAQEGREGTAQEELFAEAHNAETQVLEEQTLTATP